MALTYEQQRLQNIRDNEVLLKSLGLSSVSVITPKKSSVKSTPNSKKRKIESIVKETEGAKASLKRSASQQTVKAIEEPLEVSGSRRRSLRMEGRGKPDYVKEQVSGSPAGTPSRSNSKWVTEDDEGDLDDRQRKANRLGKRTQNPKTYGQIPGVEVLRWWPTRMEASTDAIHAPTVAGISGNAQAGAWSVALSGGYPDDVDLGYAFTYTGCGGRDLKGTKQKPKNLRTAPQTTHQNFENPLNAALKRSAETRKPVRVIRGYKLQSKYAPLTGYRYDGLYIVEKAWMAKGLTSNLMVCRYAFKRMAGQVSLPERDDLEAEAATSEGPEDE